ncbi:hypothetical protein AK830_g7820 [Neonectria ditissima]|uniref:Uncharacterized protein n=1 Tax=Neonectria ditissima TaxID=78410 RepID=A0A0P7BDZ7_9HYPO|nr:hypothetical protein AK830_g7820 [Neonectria ditissima]
MASPGYEPPLKELHANRQQTTSDKPSPLRISKQRSSHCQEDVFCCPSDLADHKTRTGEPAPQGGSDSLAMQERRTPDGVHQTVGKENENANPMSRVSYSVGQEQLRSLQEAKRRAWDGSPPHHQGVASSSPLTCGSPPAATFSASCGIRRAAKARPPLSNLHGASADSPWPLTPRLHNNNTSLTRLGTPVEALGSAWRPGPACVLTPHVEVTSEVAALEAGQHTWWVAIEISGRISAVPSGDMNHGIQEFPERSEICMRPSGQHWRGDLMEFGNLYDLGVEVLPTGSSSILQVLREEPFPIRISAESSILVLAQIQIDAKNAPQARKARRGHVRHNSEDLMEDLAVELGDARLGYAHIRVSYRHSAFPTFKDATSVGGGVSNVQSRVDTVATASVNLHNSQSPWSPPPARVLGTLLPLLQRHWGVEKAIAAMQRMESYTCAPRTLAEMKPRAWPQLDVKDDTHHIAMPTASASTNAAPLVPLRHASLQRNVRVRESRVAMNPFEGLRRVTPGAASVTSRNSSRTSSPGPSQAGQRKQPSACVTAGRAPGPSPSPPEPTGARRQSSAYWEQQTNRLGSGLWKRRSLGAETLSSRGLPPRKIDVSMAARDHEASTSTTSRSGPVREGATPPAKSKKDAGRWGWGAWF